MRATAFQQAQRLRRRNTLWCMNRWWDYVVRTAGTDEQKAIAEHSDIGTTVMSRWFKGKNEPSAKLVVAFARAYERPPVEALVAAGYLSEKEAADVIRVDRKLDVLSDDELLTEVRRRMGHPRPTSDLAHDTESDTSGIDRGFGAGGGVEKGDHRGKQVG